MNIPMILTDAGFTAFVNGRQVQAAASHKQYDRILELAHAGDWNGVSAILDAETALVNQMKAYGDVQVDAYNNRVTFKGLALGGHVVDLILEMAAKGLDAKPMVRFLERCVSNPIPTAVDELWLFLEKGKFPITDDGCFVAYKKVNFNWTDIHTGTVDYSPGASPFMPREECDPNRDNECSRGLHFCSHHYLPSFGTDNPEKSRVLMVKIAPEDLVSIPRDYDNSKGRTWRMLSLGQIGQVVENWGNPVVVAEVGSVSAYEGFVSVHEGLDEDEELDALHRLEDDEADEADEVQAPRKDDAIILNVGSGWQKKLLAAAKAKRRRAHVIDALFDLAFMLRSSVAPMKIAEINPDASHDTVVFRRVWGLMNILIECKLVKKLKGNAYKWVAREPK